MQNSKFLQFVSKMSRGELIIDDNQVKPATTSGDWATEYQQQYNGPSTWADEFTRAEASTKFCESILFLCRLYYQNKCLRIYHYVFL